MPLTPQNLELGLSRDDVLSQLDAILSSASFLSSKRCQDFLRYITLEALDGRSEAIKERTIALDVFGRGVHQDSGEDSLVRVKAREVRKRLAAYYEAVPDAPIHIDLPLGGYSPRFRPVSAPSAAAVLALQPQIMPAPVSGRNRRWLFLPVIAITAIAMFSYWLSRDASPLNRFWRPVLGNREPLIIFVPMLTDHGEITDRVGVGAAQAAAHLAAYMTRVDHAYVFKVGADLSFSDLRRQPSVLLGGFSSFWTLEMSRNLRFQLLDEGYRRVLDAQTKREWLPVGARPHNYADEDYGIACRLLDSKSGQVMMIAAGTTTFGTQAAAELLLDPVLLAGVVKNAPPDWESKNFEAVIHTSIIGATPGPPKVVATYFW